MSRILLLAAMLCACGSGAAQDAAPDARVDLCLFSPAQPQWVIESEALTVTLACQTGAELSDLRLGSLPEGASFDATSKVLRWTPGLDQAAVYRVSLNSELLSADGELSAERDWQRWQSEYDNFPRWSGRSDLRSYQEEVEYTRTWIADRWQFVHENYL